MLVQHLVPKQNEDLAELEQVKQIFSLEGHPKTMPQAFGATPDVLLRDGWSEGLDNPIYYDPEILGVCSDAERYRKKRSPPTGVLPTYPATLTKVPALRRWKLDFRATPRRCSQDIQWGKFLAIILLVCILLLLLAGVAVIAHMAVQTGINFTDSWFRFEGSVSSTVDVQFRIINRNYTSDMENVTSASFGKLVAELKHSMDVIFMDSSLSSNYNMTENFRFSNGSVIVNCRVLMKNSITNAVHQVGMIFIEALEKGHGMLFPGIFYVDVHTIRFNAANENEHHFLLDIFDEKKNATWTDWSEWSSCLTNQGLCDVSRVRIRKRECRFQGGDKSDVNRCILRSGEDVVVQTKSCFCPPPTPASSPQTIPYQSEMGAWSEWGAWTSCSDLSNRCDARQAQRRKRNCLKHKPEKFMEVEETTEILPNAICTRNNGETSIEFRLCSCSEKETTENVTSFINFPRLPILFHKHLLLRHSRPKKWILQSLFRNRTRKFQDSNSSTC